MDACICTIMLQVYEPQNKLKKNKKQISYIYLYSYLQIYISRFIYMHIIYITYIIYIYIYIYIFIYYILYIICYIYIYIYMFINIQQQPCFALRRAHRRYLILNNKHYKTGAFQAAKSSFNCSQNKQYALYKYLIYCFEQRVL